MARFHFHQTIGGLLIEDREGQEFDSATDARAAGIAAARCILADAVRDGEDLSGERIEIAGADGERIETLRFVDALPFRVCPRPRNCASAASVSPNE